MKIEIYRHCYFETSSSIMMVHCLHKLLYTNFILEQILKMGTVLSPFLLTKRHQFKTLQYPDIKSTNDNL